MHHLKVINCSVYHLTIYRQKNKIYGKVMSRDVPICNILAICREVLNRENRDILMKIKIH